MMIFQHPLDTDLSHIKCPHCGGEFNGIRSVMVITGSLNNYHSRQIIEINRDGDITMNMGRIEHPHARLNGLGAAFVVDCENGDQWAIRVLYDRGRVTVDQVDS